jgi:hypothetical protein
LQGVRIYQNKSQATEIYTSARILSTEKNKVSAAEEDGIVS